MKQLLYVFVNFVYYFIGALQIMMFIRAVLSWLPIDEDGAFSKFVYSVTEPVIVPIRMLLDRVGFLKNLPIDISFFVAFILLSILQSFLPTVIL